MRIAWVLVGVGMLATACAMKSSGEASSIPEAEQTGLGDPNVRAKLRELGLQASAATGVPSPKTLVAVASPDHQMAEEMLGGDIVPGHEPVYVVEVTGGHFVAKNASVPPGASAPEGNAITLTVDAQTFRVTDLGLSSIAPDLTQISPDVVDLLAK